MNVFERFWMTATRPAEYFKKHDTDGRYLPIVLYYVVAVAISSAVELIAAIPYLLRSSPEQLLAFSLLMVFFTFLLGIAFSFAMPFIIGAIVHLGILVFGGRQGFHATFRVVVRAAVVGVAYALITNLILALSGGYAVAQEMTFQTIQDVIAYFQLFAPYIIISFVIGLISLAHRLYIDVLGLSVTQKLSKWRAFFGVIFIPLILILIAVVLLTALGVLLAVVSTAAMA